MVPLMVLYVLLASAAANLPSGWKICSRSAPDHNECMKGQIQSALLSLGKGVPELKIAPLEPLPITNQAIAVNPAFNLTLVNGTITGFTKINLLSVQSDPWKTLKLKMFDELFLYEFNYTASGILFTYKIKSEGTGWMRIENVTREINITFSDYEKDGKTYLEVKEMNVDEHAQMASLEFHPFGRSANYKWVINQVVNDNWKELMEEQRKLGFIHNKRLYMGFVNSILAKIPKEDFDRP